MEDMLRTLLVIALTLESAGVAVSLMLVIDAHHDVEVVTENNVGNGRRIVAISSYLTERIRLAALCFLLLSSAGSTATLWSIEPERITFALLFSMWMFELGIVAILFQSITVYRTRRKLFDGFRRKHVSSFD